MTMSVPVTTLITTPLTLTTEPNIPPSRFSSVARRSWKAPVVCCTDAAMSKRSSRPWNNSEFMNSVTSSGARATSCWACSIMRGTTTTMNAVITRARARITTPAATARGNPLVSSRRTRGSSPRQMNAAVTIHPTSPPTLVST